MNDHNTAAITLINTVAAAYSHARDYQAGDHTFERLLALTAQLELGAVKARNLIERYTTEAGPPRAGMPRLKEIPIGGYIGMVGDGHWLHIQLNTLLPHCRFQAPVYLTDTITRLLNRLKSRRGKLPYYESAFVVIDEHCDIKSHNAYDQDNKGWKAVPNALKGYIFPDDDQFTMGLALIATRDAEPSCNIYPQRYVMVWRNHAAMLHGTSIQCSYNIYSFKLSFFSY